MSIAVELDALRTRIGEYGPGAYLLSVRDRGDGPVPHVVSVPVSVDGDRLLVDVGERTRANLESRRQVTLLWPAPPGGAYSLIVDAVVDVTDPQVALVPVSAVLHRVVEAGAGPSCLPVDQPDGTDSAC